jgi:hypothetical protein
MHREIDSQLRLLVEEAEKALILGQYAKSESISNNVLTMLLESIPSEDAKSLKERAAIVFVQSVFETSNFTTARSRLSTWFTSLELVPANAILLWISLALETEERRHADALVLVLLKSKASRRSGWSREQYLTLVHMYATDILLPSLKDPSEVHLWLKRQTFVPLDPRERQYLEAEIAAKALSQSNTTSVLKDDPGPRAGLRDDAVPIISPPRAILRDDTVEKKTILSGSSPEKPLYQSLLLSRGSNSFDTRRSHSTDLAISPVPGEDYQSIGVSLLSFQTEEGKETMVHSSSSSQEMSFTKLDLLGSVQQVLFRYVFGMKNQVEEQDDDDDLNDENNREGSHMEQTSSLVSTLAGVLVGVATVSIYLKSRRKNSSLKNMTKYVVN